MFPMLQIFGINKPSNQSIEIGNKWIIHNKKYIYVCLYYSFYVFGQIEVHQILIWDKEGRYKRSNCKFILSNKIDRCNLFHWKLPRTLPLQSIIQCRWIKSRPRRNLPQGHVSARTDQFNFFNLTWQTTILIVRYLYYFDSVTLH